MGVGTQELRAAKDILTEFVEDAYNLADVFTKCMNGSKFKFRVDRAPPTA